MPFQKHHQLGILIIYLYLQTLVYTCIKHILKKYLQSKCPTLSHAQAKTNRALKSLDLGFQTGFEIEDFLTHKVQRSLFSVPEPFLFPARCTDAAEKGKVAFFRRSLQKFSAGGAVAVVDVVVVDVVVHISTVVE